LERDLATLRDAVARLQITEEERTEMSEVYTCPLSEKPKSDLEDIKEWELEAQPKNKEGYEKKIKQLKSTVALKEAELARYQKAEQRLLTEVAARRETQRQRTAKEVGVELRIKTLSKELQSKLTSAACQAVKVLLFSCVCISSRNPISLWDCLMYFLSFLSVQWSVSVSHLFVIQYAREPGISPPFSSC
jgi:hypothetical protein